MAGHDLMLVDAFADQPHTGNPAAVVLLESPPTPDWMQRVAAEMNQSETAFCWPRGGLDIASEPMWTLRWYTPTTQVELCGHGTLATAHALWETGRLGPDTPALFHTRGGLLQAWRVPGPPVEIELDLPADPDESVTLSQEIARAFRLPLRYLGRNRTDFVVELESEAAVRSLDPDLDLLREAGGRCFIATAKASPDAPWDFVLRVFAPSLGLDEDPVTGSAFCLLGPYWSLRLGRPDLVGRQVSARGGTVRVHTSEQRVRLGGSAVTVFEGKLKV